jgi:hypothetical protein
MVPARTAKFQGDVPLRGKSGSTSVWAITL